jgi:hypothetical protein
MWNPTENSRISTELSLAAKKLLSEIEDPKFEYSSTESAEPKRVIPKIDTLDPIRQKLRKDKADPKWMQSSTEIVEPKRIIP